MYHAHWLAIQPARDVIDANNRTVEDNGSTIAHANRGINIAVMKFRFDSCILQEDYRDERAERADFQKIHGSNR